MTARTRAACVFGLLLAIVVAAAPAAATPINKLVISEVMTDPNGNDNGREWIEIYNGNAFAVDLSQYSLRWGRNSLANSVALSAVMLAPDTTYVIGGPSIGSYNGDPVYNQVVNFGPDLYNGTHATQEDAVALVVTATNALMHILVYGGDGVVTTFVDEQNATAVAVNVSAMAQGNSIEYQGANTWIVQGTATPGSVPVTVPEPGTGLLVCVGLAVLASQRRR